MKYYLFFFISALLITFIFIGCHAERDLPTDTSVKKESVKTLVEVSDSVVAYGNNIFYFPFVGSDFGNQLNAFLNHHRELKVSTITNNVGYGIEGYGTNKGYFVVFEKK